MIKISIVIPVFNSENWIQETLKSAIAQTFPAHEIIVIDDGSTDRTADIVLSFGDKIRYLKQEHQGLSAARNTAIQHATGDWMAFLDHDDLFDCEKLNKQRAIIEANPDLQVVYCGFSYLYFDGSTKPFPVFPAKNLWPALRYKTPILPSTSIVRRSALLEVGGFEIDPSALRIEDWNLWFRLIRRFSVNAFRNIDERLLLYRDLPNSESKAYLPTAANSFKMLDSMLLEGLSGWKRTVWKNRIEARFYYRLSIALREHHNDRYWEYALESMLKWPFFGKIVPFYRYRVFAHMVYVRLQNFRFNFRYWWPIRRCRDVLENTSSD